MFTLWYLAGLGTESITTLNTAVMVCLASFLSSRKPQTYHFFCVLFYAPLSLSSVFVWQWKSSLILTVKFWLHHLALQLICQKIQSEAASAVAANRALCGNSSRACLMATRSAINARSTSVLHLISAHHKDERELTTATTEELHELLAFFLSSRSLPFSLVEVPAFHCFIRALHPTYQIPSRWTLTSTIFPNLYHQIELAMQLQLEQIPFVSITFNGWSDSSSCKYLGVTAHGINYQWEMKSFLLENCAIPNELATTLVAEMKGIAAKWGVADRIVTCTTDGAATMIAAASMMHIPRVYCLAHAIN